LEYCRIDTKEERLADKDISSMSKGDSKMKVDEEILELKK